MAQWDIGRIGQRCVERAQREWTEKVRGDEFDGRIQGLRVTSSDGQGGRRNVARENRCLKFERYRNRDCAGTRADVNDASAPAQALDGNFDDVFRFRPGNQDVRRNAELVPIKLLSSSYVLGRLTGQPLM